MSNLNNAYHNEYPGPWNGEPIYEEFEYRGHRCIARRGGFDAWCGYVSIPIDHRYAQEKDNYEIPVDIHGGITWCDDRLPWLRKSADDNNFWLGFDCIHAGDMTPKPTIPPEISEKRNNLMNLLIIGGRFTHEETYKDIDFVRKEMRSLVDQLEDMKDEISNQS